MPEDVSPLPPIAPEPAADPAPEPALDLGPGPGVNIGEEFGTAKRNLPPAKIVGIVLAAAALLLGIFAFLDRAKPQGGGSVDNIAVGGDSEPERGSGGGKCHPAQRGREASVDP